MLKKSRMMLAMLCALCILAAAGSGSAQGRRGIRAFIGRIEQGCIPMLGEMSIIPDDCSGFELLVRSDLAGEILDEMIPGLPEPQTGEDGGMIRYVLDGDTARRLLETAYTASIGPDGSMLRFVYDSACPFIMVQHGKSLVLMAQSSGRGAPDTDGGLKDVLNYKLRTTSEPVDGEVCWSPDGRWLFFNDTDGWRSTRMKLNDPYLLDTQTGDIFLLESSGNPKNPVQGMFRCVMNGCFSADGKSFYWYCRDFVSGTQSAHFLMRYDLDSGTQETVCELKGAMLDFCEISNNRWFLLESAGSGTNLVRLAFSPDGIERTEEPLPDFCHSCVFFPAVQGNVLLAATPLPSGGTYLLPLSWDTVDTASWRKIGSIHDVTLQEVSPDEIEAELQAAKNRTNTVTGSGKIGTAQITHAAAIIDVTDLLLTVSIREPVPDSWGGGFSDFNGQIILNTENLKQFPIETGMIRDGLQDSVVDGECFLAKGYGWDVIGLYSLYTLPEIQFMKGETYLSPYGSFMCRNESDPLVFTSVTLKNHECAADITVSDDGYTIQFHITDDPEPETIRKSFTVPEVLTVDRWEEIKSALSKKDQKKLASVYMRSTPERLAERADRDEILACYPSAATETLYILPDNLKISSLETADSALKAAGYTAEDYARDMSQVAVPRETNVIVTKNGSTKSSVVRYTFTVPDPLLYPGSARIQELAGLCERIGKALMANRFTAEPLPAESVILDQYDMGSVDFYVTVTGAEETETTLELSLAVHP